MNFQRFISVKAMVAAMAATGLLIYGFYAVEAKKEVYYLCQNFQPGESMASVLMQLDTAELSSYQLKDLNPETELVQSSSLNFHLYQCRVVLDFHNRVISADFQ